MAELLSPAAAKIGGADGVTGLASNLFAGTANGALPDGASAQGGRPGVAAVLRSEAISRFVKKLSVIQVARSNVVSIKFESLSPLTAAAIVNAVADTYIDAQLESKFEATQTAADWINDRLADLEATVQASERKIEDFRADVGLVDGVSAPLLTERVSRVNAELAGAQAQVTETEARLAEVRRLNGANIDTVAAVLGSQSIRSLRQDAVLLSRRRADLSTEYGGDHPIWASLNADAADLQAKIQEEITRIVDNFSSEARVARTRVAELSRRTDQLEGLAGDASRAGVQLRALERDADADRRLYELFLTRYKETAIQDGIQQPDARVVSYSDVPAKPSHPKKPLILAVAFVVSVLLGLTFAMIVERLDFTAFRTAKELERVLRLPVFGQIPTLSRRVRRRHSPETFALAKPTSSYAEAIRGIHTSMFLRGTETALRVILVTSSLPGEGKTSTAASLARMLSRAGKRTVAIDCDLRRPRLHEALDTSNEVGLLDFLQGETSELVVHKDRHTDLHFVTAGQASTEASELLHSDGMSRLLANLRERYDVVVLDSPPVLAVVDARVLAQMADATVFLVNWGKTRRKIVQAAIALLQEAEPPLLGCVLNNVDVKRMSGYGYGDAGAYYGAKKYSKYYAG